MRLEFPSLEARQGPEMEIDQAAKVAELAYAPDLESGARKGLGVRVPPFARIRFPINGICQVQRLEWADHLLREGDEPQASVKRLS